MGIWRPIAFCTISPVPTSPLQPWAVSPPSEIGWSSPVQMGVEMLNRGGASHKSRDQNATQGSHNLGHPQAWQKCPHSPFPLILCASWSETKLFAQLACGWQELGNEHSMLRIRAGPQPAHVGPVGYCMRGAWCVVRAAWCVVRVYVLQCNVQ